VLCRSPAQNAVLADRLRRAGRHVLELPTFDIEFLPGPLPAPRSADWVVFVSGHALEGLLRRGLQPSSWAEVRLAAIGARTGARVAEALGRAVLTPELGEAGDAQALMQVLEPRLLAQPQSQVWLVRGEPGGRWLPDRLQQLGVLQECVVYRQQSLPWPGSVAESLRHPALATRGWIWVLTSVRIVETVIERLEALGLSPGPRDRALVVHPRIAERAQRWWPCVEVCSSLDGLAPTIESAP
jgi:uroporphyrinogen-III synthase